MQLELDNTISVRFTLIFGANTKNIKGHTTKKDIPMFHAKKDISVLLAIASLSRNLLFPDEALSGQQSAKDVGIMKFLLKAESSMLIALIRKWVFPDEH